MKAEVSMLLQSLELFALAMFLTGVSRIRVIRRSLGRRFEARLSLRLSCASRCFVTAYENTTS